MICVGYIIYNKNNSTYRFLLTPSKLEKLERYRFFDDLEKNGVSYSIIDPTSPCSCATHYQIIVHKLLDLYTLQDKYSKKSVSWLERVHQMYPNILLLDSIDHLKKWLRRDYTYHITNQVIQECHMSSILHIPSFCFIEHSQSIHKAIRNHNIHLPLLLKPNDCLGKKSSHKIKIIMNKSDIPLNIPIDVVAQEYINHNAIIYKLYCFGNECFIECRKSLPNIPKERKSLLPYVIDNKKIVPSFFPQKTNLLETSKNQTIEPEIKISYAENKVIQSSSLFDIITQKQWSTFLKYFQKITNIKMVGIDFIIDNNECVYIIDINEFPGYKRFPDLSTRFACFLKEQFHSSQ
ncbi:hypothetical protein WA158_008497 [Blastocystis sp. Blastoise]